ncbi:MAG TPA: polymer-forming cytoskeletal protein [Bacillota bacterium]|nr:polymer-forming cytoskeletal protein [Bacillota bacterium]
MECHEYERLFEKYFNRDITILEYKAIRSHLGRCQQCRELFLDHLFTTDLLDNMPMNEPAHPLLEQVLQKLPEKRGGTDWRRWSMGVAACILLAATLTVVEQNMDRENHGIKAALVASSINQMKPGQHRIIIPNNTVIKGNLQVQGDVVVLGKVDGRLQANRVVLVRSDSDFFQVIGEKFKKLFEGKSGKNEAEEEK